MIKLKFQHIMNKQTLINTYFQREQLLTPENKDYRNSLHYFFYFIINADHIGVQDFVLLQITGNGTAQVVSKQNGVIAGIEEVVHLIHKFTNLKIDTKTTDGSLIKESQEILSVSGKNADLLAYERVILNTIGRMSGITTYTNALTNRFSIPLAATRKTPWMLLDKKAVAVGGGITHRLSLSDWPMIKDNHLKALQNELGISAEETISEAIKRMLADNTQFFEIEVETAGQAETAIKSFDNMQKANSTMALLLDNFTPQIAQQTINRLKKLPGYGNIIIEASGGITENNLSDWDTTGVDIISLGTLTHSAPNFDVSMRFLNS